MSDIPSLRILVADDEPMISRALARVLEKRGHRVETAADADEGLSCFRDGAFDVVVVDQNMPGNGLTLLRTILESGFAGYAALMTGGADDGEIGGLPGEVVRLQKPFRFNSVADQIEQEFG